MSKMIYFKNEEIEREILDIMLKPLKDEVRSELFRQSQIFRHRVINFIKNHSCQDLWQKSTSHKAPICQVLWQKEQEQS